MTVFATTRAVVVGLLVTCGIAALSSTPAAADAPRVGDVVFAQWKPNSWYHGRVDRPCPGGLHVRFDDGDQACRPTSQIAVDRSPRGIGSGARVVARWTTGKMYPGRVGARLPNGLYNILFDDGGRRAVSISDIRTIGY